MQNRLPQHQRYPMHRAVKILMLVDRSEDDSRESIERQLMHLTTSRITVGRGIEDPQSSHEIGNPPMGLPPLPPPA